MTCRRFIEHRHEAKNSRSIALKAGKLVNNKVQKRKHDVNIRKKKNIHSMERIWTIHTNNMLFSTYILIRISPIIHDLLMFR